MRSQPYDDLAFAAQKRSPLREMTASKKLHDLGRRVWIFVPAGSSMIRWHMLFEIGELEAFRAAVTIGRQTKSKRLILTASFCI